MRIKAVDIIIGGEILAEPILTDKKEVLIPKGAVLKEDYVPLIQSLGIESLCVEDPYETYEDPNPIIDRSRLDAFVAQVRKIMEGHIYHGQNKSLREFEIIANEIVKEIKAAPDDVVIDMNERTANLYEHTVMVTLLAVNVAKKLHLDAKKQYNIALGCLLHDLGIRYITVPYENCNWDDREPGDVFEFKKHTILGYSALDDESWIPPISRKMILSHHEKMDGSGFPMRQQNKEIECKIIQACDTFDSYISGMECKRISVQQALAIMSEEADVKYDKKVVDYLIAMIAKYPVGTTVKTSASKEGVVISQTVDPENPIIMLLSPEFSQGLEENKMNLYLEKDVSILQVV